MRDTAVAAGRRRECHEFLGFRKRDLKQKLLGDQTRPSRTKVGRSQSGQVTRWLTLLRVHHWIKTVSHTHRYLLTEQGRLIITAILAAQNASTKQLAALAASKCWRLAAQSRTTHRVPASTIRRWMQAWRSDLTVEHILNYHLT